MNKTGEKVIIQHSPISGRGLFAAGKIKKNEKIFVIQGPVIDYPFLPDYRTGANWLNIGYNKWKIPYRENIWNYINHSCNPNAGLNDKFEVVAMTDIPAGREVTIDYSLTEAASNWKMKCNCQSKNCRKIIRSVQFLPLKLFLKYRPYIPKFLQNAYKAQKTYSVFDGKNRKLFAKNNIRKDEVLFTVSGPTIKYRKAPNYKIGYKWLGIGKNKWIIPLRQNPWYFIRHSCDPNCGLRNRVQVVAMQRIRANKEITLDDSITEANPDWKMACRCQAKNCRKIIR